MANFQWTNELDVQVDSMNDQHKILISMMNDLEDLVKSESDYSSQFYKFYDYTIEHFRNEEQLMEDRQFPNLESHQRVHARLLSRLDHFRDMVEKGGQLNEDFFVFLQNWLKTHIRGIDMQYGSFMNREYKERF